MRIVIVGAGKIGSNLAKMLVERGNEVIVIDVDEERCSRLSAEIDALIIKGDATKLETLKDAEVDRADVFVAVTDRDEVNVLSCLIAKQLGSTRTISRVGDPALVEVVEGLGVERAVCPELVTARLLSSLVSGSYGLTELLASRGGFKLLEVAVSPSSPIVGKTIKEVPKPPTCMILAVEEGDKVLKASDDLELKEGQRVIVLVGREDEEEVKKLFTG